MLNKYTTVIVGDVIDLDMGTFADVVEALDPFQDPPNEDQRPECMGHPGDGITDYCDGSCRRYGY